MNSTNALIYRTRKHICSPSIGIVSGSELMQAPPLYFGTGTIDGDEEGGALGKENGNVVVEDEEDGEDELGTWNLEL